ncbi:hypothetical protein M747DRAFT_161405 [Aspergillus niger ATCC 13496]|uniref:Uncharacterized protein n=1 Tax=Aspergillus niger ATCC 13496 TaxID=1353008 RepID=A0A370BJ28_ASPNG|nr:hypothetical protein M747DRAFT_161405 [Aspergillus niger ATCC 13496]
MCLTAVFNSLALSRGRRGERNPLTPIVRSLEHVCTHSGTDQVHRVSAKKSDMETKAQRIIDTKKARGHNPTIISREIHSPLLSSRFFPSFPPKSNLCVAQPHMPRVYHRLGLRFKIGHHLTATFPAPAHTTGVVELHLPFILLSLWLAGWLGSEVEGREGVGMWVWYFLSSFPHSSRLICWVRSWAGLGCRLLRVALHRRN